MIGQVRIQTPLGETGIIYQSKPFGLIRVLLPGNRWDEGLAFLSKLNRCRLQEHRRGLDEKVIKVIESITDYFNKGYAVRIPWQWLRMDSLTALQQAVLRATAEIPFGELKSYREIAEAIGRPRAYRFVGNTLARNPFPIIIPCHRVVRSDASIGQFGGGAEMKRKLIEMEVFWRAQRLQADSRAVALC